MNPKQPGRPRLSEADTAALVGAKRALRAAVAQRRAARSVATRASADHARTERVQAFIGDLSRPGLTVAAYLSVRDEPDTLELISWLTVQGLEVLLPVMRSPTEVEPGGIETGGFEAGGIEPRWGRYTGPDGLVAGRYGIGEPDGEVLPASALTAAHLVLVPGLAGNEQGHRLGRGGGWYDRALGETDAVRVLLLNDSEVLPAIPIEPTDQQVDVLITESRTINCVAS